MGRMEGGGAGTIGAPPAAGGRIRPPRAPEVQPRGAARPEDVVLARFPRGERAEVRASVSAYRGAPVLALRLWWQAADGVWRPTRKGIAVHQDEVAQLRTVLGELAAPSPLPSSTAVPPTTEATS